MMMLVLLFRLSGLTLRRRAVGLSSLPVHARLLHRQLVLRQADSPHQSMVQTADDVVESATLKTRLIDDSRSLAQLVQLPCRTTLPEVGTMYWLYSVATMARRSGAAAQCFVDHDSYQICRQRLVDADGSYTVPVSSLVQTIRALIDVNVPLTDPVLLLVIKMLKMRFRTMPYLEVVKMLGLVRRGSDDSVDMTSVLIMCANIISERRVEVVSVNCVFGLINNWDLFDSQLHQHVEGVLIECIPSLETSDCALLMSKLAFKGLRLVAILRSVTHCEAHRNTPCSLSHAITILDALNRLNYHDGALLDKLAGDLPQQIAALNSAERLTQLLTCCGLLRWRTTQLLDAAVDWYRSPELRYSARDAAALLQTLAFVNYRAPGLDDALLTRLVDQAGLLNTPRARLDLVWSLSVLRRVTDQQLASVLDPTFVDQLEHSMGSRMVGGPRFKLLNLSALSATRHSYTGPVLSAVYNTAPLTRSSVAQQLQDQVLDALSHFLPPPKYLTLTRSTGGGVAVCAEFVLNQSGQPCDVTGLGSALPGAPSPTPRLADDQRRIALCCWVYRDFTRGGDDSAQLTGINQLSVDVLKACGYHVLHVSHQDFYSIKSIADKVKFLREKAVGLVMS